MGNRPVERIPVALLAATALLSLTATAVHADTVPGTLIANTATASYRVGGFLYEVASPVDTVVVDTMPPGSTTAVLELLRYDSAGGSPLLTVAPTEFLDSGAVFVPILPPAPPDGASGTVVDRPLPLIVAGAYRRSEIVFVRVIDLDRNVDYAAVDTVVVRLVIDRVGDVEVLRLVETGLSTGQFVGYVVIDAGAGATPDGRLGAGSNSSLLASYSDPEDTLDSHGVRAEIDPRGVVFDSSTGATLDGVTVWLLEETSKMPATVYGDDGSSTFPSNVVTGSTVTDSSGTVYEMASGEYLFPTIPEGNYDLVVTFPADAGFTWPTDHSDADLQSLPGGPFAVVDGSRGETFSVGPEPVRIDLPADPLASTLFVTKTADRETVTPGDFFQYRVTVTGTRTFGPIANVQVEDVLPPGFRYQAGSARWSETGIDEPLVGPDARTLRSLLPTLEPGATIELRYVVEAATPTAGKARSTAQARGGDLVSNVAEATVVIDDDLRRDQTLILGRLSVVEAGALTGEGLGGVRVLLEDGSYTLTDARGRFHLEDVAPGTHVVQLDAETLPTGYRPVLHGRDPLATANPLSRFVEIQGGNAWHLDFYAERTGAAARATSPEAISEKVAAQETPEVFDQVWLEQQPLGWDWLLPQPGARPLAPSIRITVKHAPDESFSVLLNGRKIDAIHHDGTLTVPGKNIAMSVWSSVDLQEGESAIEIVRRDAAGGERSRQRRVVYVAGAPAQAELVPERSTLVADGRTPPVIAVRLIDRHGRPAREDLSGAYFVDEPYAPGRTDDFEVGLLPGATAGRARFTIEQDGIAFLELQPTTVSGRVMIRLPLTTGEEEIWADLRDVQRDWVLVGIAEGEAGHGTITDHLEPLAGPDEADTYDDRRVALYAKGRVRGGWILSVAYDSDKKEGVRSELHGTIDPDAHYLVYGEADGRRPGAASSEKLYLKLEREALAVLFGDYHLNWTVTELSAYRRDFNGLLVTQSGPRLWAGAFASDTAQRLKRDDILGQGISGPYELSGGDIVLFSESVGIEVRDRFRSEIVLSRRPLSRNVEYTIDYDASSVMLRETLFTTDLDLNHQYLVVTYETESAEDDRLTYGGRLELRAAPGVRVGATRVDESEDDGRDLTGIDARISLTDRTELRAEIAQTHDPVTGEEDRAYMAEVVHVGERLQGKAYVREREEDFGLGQLSGAERGTRKVAAEGAYRLGDRLTVRGLAATEEQLTSDARRKRLEASAEFREGPWRLSGGLRGVDDELSDGSEQRSRTVAAGVERSLLEEQLRLRVDHEESLSDSTESIDFPRRTRLGLDYRLNGSAEIFAEQEWTEGTLRDTSQLRTGIKSRPWQGAQAFGSVSRAGGDASELAAAAGLRQRWTVTPTLSVDFGVEHDREIGADSGTGAFGRPPAASPLGDSTAAAAALTWKPGAWIHSTRIEYRDSDSGDSRNLQTSAQVAPGGSLGFLGGLRLLESDTGAEDRLGFDLRLGVAYRPDVGRWTVLDRMDFTGEDTDSSTSPRDSRKLVNNLLGVYRPSPWWQVAFHHGVKYTREILDGDRYSGWTHLLGGELRRGLGERWDVGLHGNALYSANSRVATYGYGASVGRHLARNLWTSVGYNGAGIEDRDLDSAGFDRDGWFFRFRLKFDQESVRGLLRFLEGRSSGPETHDLNADDPSDEDPMASRPSDQVLTPEPVEPAADLPIEATLDPDDIGRLRLHVAESVPSPAVASGVGSLQSDRPLPISPRIRSAGGTGQIPPNPRAKSGPHGSFRDPETDSADGIAGAFPTAVEANAAESLSPEPAGSRYTPGRESKRRRTLPLAGLGAGLAGLLGLAAWWWGRNGHGGAP